MRNKMTNEKIPKTIRESIDLYRRNLLKEVYDKIMPSPEDNHVFRMKGEAESIKNSLVFSGKFEIINDKEHILYSEEGNHLRNPEFKTWITFAHPRVHKAEADSVAEGWVYSTIHPEVQCGVLEQSIRVLNTIDDLLIISESGQIPMKTHYISPERQWYEVGYNPLDNQKDKGR